jgi:hypothetical protein
MKSEVTFQSHGRYLHAVVTGANSKENVAGYLEVILNECLSRRIARVLIEERLEGPRLGMVDVFDIAADGSGRIAGMFEAIAFVDVYAVGGTMKFAETVALNRGAPLRVSATVTEAHLWLEEM